MTDPEDKSGSRSGKSWADRIPLVTLLAVVFAAGLLYARIEFLGKDVARIEKAMAATDARTTALEQYRLTHEAAAVPLMNQYAKDLADRNERKKR